MTSHQRIFVPARDLLSKRRNRILGINLGANLGHTWRRHCFRQDFCRLAGACLTAVDDLCDSDASPFEERCQAFYILLSSLA
jgi:hypothetical protein